MCALRGGTDGPRASAAYPADQGHLSGRRLLERFAVPPPQIPRRLDQPHHDPRSLAVGPIAERAEIGTLPVEFPIPERTFRPPALNFRPVVGQLTVEEFHRALHPAQAAARSAVRDTRLPATRAGITLAAATYRPTIHNNRVWDSQPNQTQTHGLQITDTGTCESGWVHDNQWEGNAVAATHFETARSGGCWYHNLDECPGTPLIFTPP